MSVWVYALVLEEGELRLSEVYLDGDGKPYAHWPHDGRFSSLDECVCELEIMLDQIKQYGPYVYDSENDVISEGKKKEEIDNE